MANRRITCNAFSQNRLFQCTGSFNKQPLNPTVLVTQMYFKMQYQFAMADETKMARFNDACMNGAYADFMEFVPVDGIEGIIIHSL